MTDREAARLSWIGVWAPPVAWALQHAIGVMLGFAQCGPNGRRWQVSLDTWEVATAVVAGIVAAVGILAAIRAFRATTDRADTPPPGSRIHFIAAMALATGPLFLAIIVLNGLGTGLGELCRQS
jgi:hypothetical protein